MATRKPLLVGSLYRHAMAVQDEDSTVIFLNPERVSFEDRDDTTIYISNGTEYLWDMAQTHYGNISLGDISLIEVIAQFQPDPIQDLSIRPKEQLEMYIPSMAFINEVVLGPSLAEEPEL
jgi:hypothetical protein